MQDDRMDLRAWGRGRRLALACALPALLAGAPWVFADVVLDETLRDPAAVEPLEVEPGRFHVTEQHGQLERANLYYSFREFDLTPEQVVTFLEPASRVDRVISRVTGGPSTIAGTIESQIPGASFYFVNRHGVTFAEGVQMDLDGALFVSTADYLGFGSDPGARWRTDLSHRPVLYSGDVTEFGFLSGAPARIAVEGALGLERSLSLIAGDLDLDSSLTTNEGLALASVGAGHSERRVLLSGPHDAPVLSVPGGTPLGAISLSREEPADEDRVDEVRARSIWLRSGSLQVGSPAQITAEGYRASIGIDVSGAVDLNGRLVVNPTSLTAELIPLRIQGAEFHLGPGGSVVVSSFGLAPGTAPEGIGDSIAISVGHALTLDPGASLGTSLGGIDLRAGDPQTGTGSISLIGAQVGTFPMPGARAQLRLRAAEIALRQGTDLIAFTDGASAPRETVLLESRSLRVEGGSEIGVGVTGQADRTANSEIVLLGQRNIWIRDEGSAIRSGLDVLGPAAGDVRVEADVLRVSDGAVISAQSRNGGAAGNLFLDVDRLILDDGSLDAFADLEAGGQISVRADEFTLLRDAEVVSKGGERGGRVRIEGSGFAVLERSQITSEGGLGEGGDVDILLPLFHDSQSGIETASLEASAGRVSLTSQNPLLKEIADLPASFASVQAGLAPRCDAPRPGGRGSLVVGARPSVAPALEEWLVAFDLPSPSLTPPVGMADEAPLSPQARSIGTADAAPAGNARAPIERARDLRDVAGAQQASGQYRESVSTLRKALLAAEEAKDLQQVAASLGGLGNAYLALGDAALGLDQMELGLELARQIGALGIAARISTSVGHLRFSQAEFEEALNAYDAAAALASEAGQPLDAAGALASAARGAVRIRPPEAVDSRLARTRALLAPRGASRAAIYARIHISETELLLAERDPQSAPDRMLRAHADLTVAVAQAAELSAPREASVALGHLGALYDRDGRPEEALEATARALMAAQQLGAPELVYRWEAQHGKLLERTGRRRGAIEALRRSVALAQELHLETAHAYGAGGDAFREDVAPVYLGLVDLLLREADVERTSARAEALLRDARGTVESLRAAELRNYLSDDCLMAPDRQEQSIESAAEHSAVIYPLILDNRLELLVSDGARIRRYTATAEATHVIHVTQELSRALQEPHSESYRSSAQQLYDWVIRPFAADLEAEGVNTLVFVPYGVLRTIPIAALHDGERFLIERFAVATAPGLFLTAPRPLSLGEPRVLVGGLSQAEGQGPDLPYAEAEVNAIHTLFGGTRVLNQEFTRDRMAEELEQRYSIVHIASHASFQGDVQESYVLAHDGRISMRDLSEWIATSRFRDEPLEMIVLSACETAAGDSRAALGLAGVAIRSGARSAVGTLWEVDDEATKDAIVAFYEALKSGTGNRAEALRTAQMRMLRRPEFAHPAYWSGFLLMGSWL